MSKIVVRNSNAHWLPFSTGITSLHFSKNVIKIFDLFVTRATFFGCFIYRREEKFFLLPHILFVVVKLITVLHNFVMWDGLQLFCM